MRKILIGLLAIVVVAILGLAGWLAVSPPELLRVGDGYAAKIVCSNVFLAGRDPQQVLSVDVQAPGNPLLKLIGVAVDRDAGTVTTHMLGFVAPAVAVYRPGLGCTLAPDGNVAAVTAIALANPPVIAPANNAPWPDGATIAAPNAAVSALLGDATLVGPGARAVFVVHDGRAVAEREWDGFAGKPLLSWSMSKTVNAALVGTLVKAGTVGLDDTGLLPQWAGDTRKDIRLRDLLSMTSGLKYEEAYGDVTDTTRMLYLEPDMAGFAASKPAVAAPGARFNYSTGTPSIITRIWMNRLGDAQAGLAYPRAALFGPLGMSTATWETDAGGTFASGSYLYASAADWARFGWFLEQDGVWNGQRLLPEGFVTMMRTSNGKPGGYSQMQSWLTGPTETDTQKAGLPADTFWMEGHDGQSIAIIPSEKLVVVRLGLTPSDLGWGPEPLVKAVIAALHAPAAG